MGLGNLFKLAKLSIESYEDAEHERPVGTFDVQYNPESLSMRHEATFAREQAPGTSMGDPTYSHGSRSLSLQLVFDGTGVGHFAFERLGPDARSVADRIEALLNTCYRMNGPSHEPLFLRLRWGNRGVLRADFDCRLQAVDVRYTAFDRDGSPLHAELDVSFVEAVSSTQRSWEERKASPDLTHRRVVVAGDTLPRLCREVYGSAAHYLRVAEVNDLDDLRELEPGQELWFPPFSRRGQA